MRTWMKASYDMWKPLSLTILICVHGEAFAAIEKNGGKKSATSRVTIHMFEAADKSLGCSDGDRWVNN